LLILACCNKMIVFASLISPDAIIAKLRHKTFPSHRYFPLHVLLRRLHLPSWIRHIHQRISINFSYGTRRHIGFHNLYELLWGDIQFLLRFLLWRIVLHCLGLTCPHKPQSSSLFCFRWGTLVNETDELEWLFFVLCCKVVSQIHFLCHKLSLSVVIQIVIFWSKVTLLRI
jgi:hypothetical protein